MDLTKNILYFGSATPPSGGGGGTGAVESVNGKTGVVSLAAIDVGASTIEQLTAVDTEQKHITIEKIFDTASDAAAWVNTNQDKIRQGTVLYIRDVDTPNFIN